MLGRYEDITDVQIQNVAVSTTEADVTIPDNTIAMSVQARDGTALQWTLVDGASNTTYQTIKANNELYLSGMYLRNKTLHLYCAASKTAEIVFYVGGE